MGKKGLGGCKIRGHARINERPAVRASPQREEQGYENPEKEQASSLSLAATRSEIQKIGAQDLEQ